MPHRDISSQPMRCETLLARINPLQKSSAKPTSATCIIGCTGSSSTLTLAPPFFTRLFADADLSTKQKLSFATEFRSLGVAWLGDSSNVGDASLDPNRIAAVHCDQPIVAETLETAAAIELQMVGVPFQTFANSRRARWTPGLPIELSDFEQLGKKIDLLRNLTGNRCPIGAAISPGAVYDDIRFMVDSGFDYISLLCQVQFGLSSSSCLSLAPMESTVEQAVKAVQDSGTKTKLLVSAQLLDGPQMFRCLQMGASAVSIDAFVSHSKPQEIAPHRESIGSVLSTFVPASSNASLAWLQPAIKRLIEELTDCAIYAG